MLESESPVAERLLAAVMESAAQAILIMDPCGRIEVANARAGELFGYDLRELIGNPVEMLLPESARTAHEQIRKDWFATPHVRPMGTGLDLVGRRRDGSEFPIEVSLGYSECDGVLRAIAFVSDITIRKKLERQLAEAQNLEAVGRLAGGIAHDFNNLLTIISGYARQMAEAPGMEDTAPAFAGPILEASERAGALVQQMLAFSRRQVIRPAILNLNELVRGVEAMLERLLPDGVKLDLVLRPNLMNVKADRLQMEQVLLNLVTNARDALPQGGHVTLETCNLELDADYARAHLGVRPGDYVVLAVSDDGIGMDAETKRRIFEPFFTTKPAGRGNGLGLATVYGIVKQNEGDIWVYSEPGKGTTFKVYLPGTDAAVEIGRVAKACSPPARPLEVLVVEDDTGVRNLICELLRTKGHRVRSASDAREAGEILRSAGCRVDLLLTDLVLQGGSGAEIAAEAARLRPALRVVYMSGFTEDAAVQQGRLPAGEAYLEKPFSLEALLEKIREISS